MGKKIVLTGTNFGDTALPKLPLYDEIESAGSLFLFDPSNAFGAFTGVPASGAVIPNVVGPLASVLTGLPSSSVTGRVVSANIASGIFQLERTSKLGVHGMSTQGGSQAAAANFGIKLHNTLKDYLEANILTHQFYVSAWVRLTRQQITGGANQSIIHWAQTTSVYGYHSQGGPIVTTPNTNKNSTINTVSSANGSAGILQLACLGWTGDQSAITSTSEGLQPNFVVGAADAWASLNYNKAPSLVLYRHYIEDLTASGRSYADVAALDLSLFNSAFGVGGRFADDVYSDPALTVP